MNIEIITTINNQITEWKLGLPLSPEANQKLLSKQNLLWSYNSNHLEGNTLSYGETELLLIHGKTNGMHSVRDVDEMRAHHVSVELVRLWANESRKITEADIRNLNKILLKEPFLKQSITMDGQSAQKKIIPGEYKIVPNHVKTVTGEIFRFAEPFEVPMKMADFVSNLNNPLPDGAQEIAAHLAELHHEYILIHPFDDGNGRTIRLLLNYILLRENYPAIIIKTTDKSEYLNALHWADIGDLKKLTDFLLLCFQYALELGIKAIKGEGLQESGDVDMKLELLKRKIRAKQEYSPVSLNEKLFFCQSYIIPFAKSYEKKFSELSSMFQRSSFLIKIQALGETITFSSTREFFSWVSSHCEGVAVNIDSVVVCYYFNGIISDSSFGFHIVKDNEFKFKSLSVKWEDVDIPYDFILTESQADEIVRGKLEGALDDIKGYMENN